MGATHRQRRIAAHHKLVAESVATAQRTEATEAGQARAGATGRVTVRLIQAGWSLNGRLYSAETLKRAAKNGVFRRGLHMYVNHPSENDEAERPEGDLRYLAGALAEDARWNEATQSLEAPARLFAPWRQPILEMAADTEAPAVGLSIRTWLDGEQGEVGGRRGFIVSEIIEARSVDFVTLPAAGGKMLTAESVQRAGEARNVGNWIESRIHLGFTQVADEMFGSGRLTRAERITLSSAIGDGLGAFVARLEADAPHLYERDIWDEPEGVSVAADEAVVRGTVAEASSEEIRRALTAALREAYSTGRNPAYIWLRDYDAAKSLCWYEQSTRDGDCTNYQQGYSIAESGRITLAEQRVAVVARTVWEPAPTDASAATVRSGETATSTSDDKTSATTVTENVSPVDGPGSPPNHRKEPSVGTENTGQVAGTGGAGEPTRTPATPAPPQYAEAMHQSHEALLAQQAETTKEREARAAAERKLRIHEAKEAARTKVAEAIGKSTLAKVGAAHPRIVESVVATADVWLDKEGEADEKRLDVTIEATIAREATYLATAAEQLYGVGKVRLGASEGGPTDSVESLKKTGDSLMAEIAALSGNSPKGQ